MVNPTQPGYYASHPKKQSEYILLHAAKDADLITARNAKHKLLVENEAFLIYFIGDWLSPQSPYLFSELLQAARLAFLKAIEHYDPKRDISIRTFAKWYLVKLKEKFFEKSSFEELKETHLTEAFFEPKVCVEYKDLRDTLEEALTQLNQAEQSIIRLHFFEGMKSRAIAADRGISEARVSNIIKNGLSKMKAYLIGKGIAPGMFDFN